MLCNDVYNAYKVCYVRHSKTCFTLIDDFCIFPLGIVYWIWCVCVRFKRNAGFGGCANEESEVHKWMKSVQESAVDKVNILNIYQQC